MKETIKTIKDLEIVAAQAVDKFKQTHPHNRALVVSLIGELGAGKTAFSKCVARELGIEEDITSPTFVIEKVYTLPKHRSSFSHFVHIDAYRLSGAHELSALGWDRIIADSGNLVFVEWADRVEEIIPKGTPKLIFEVVDEHTRTLTWQE